MMSPEGSVTVRNLASMIHANKDTAGRVLRSIKKTMAKDLVFFGKIADSIRSFEDEGYF